jgi:hypothetical protein
MASLVRYAINAKGIVMRTISLAIVCSLMASPSFAISRLSPLSMSCSQARATVHQQGAVVFRWTSPRGAPLYNRFVRNSRLCQPHEYAEWTSIPTRDNRSCQVLDCENIENLGDQFVPDHSL